MYFRVYESTRNDRYTTYELVQKDMERTWSSGGLGTLRGGKRQSLSDILWSKALWLMWCARACHIEPALRGSCRRGASGGVRWDL